MRCLKESPWANNAESPINILPPYVYLSVIRSHSTHILKSRPARIAPLCPPFSSRHSLSARFISRFIYLALSSLSLASSLEHVRVSLFSLRNRAQRFVLMSQRVPFEMIGAALVNFLFSPFSLPR